MNKRPLYRVTIELLVPCLEPWREARIRAYAFDVGRIMVESRIAPATPRYSFDVATDALSLWVASDNMNWTDGPWRALPVKATAEYLGLNPAQW